MEILVLIAFWIMMLIIDWRGETILGALAKFLLLLILLAVAVGLVVVFMADPKAAMNSPTYWVILVVAWLCLVCQEYFAGRRS